QMKRVIQNEFADILTFERQIDSGRLAKYLARDIDHTESDEEVKEAEKSARALVSVLSIPPFREAAMAYYYRFITNAWQTLTFDPDQYRKDLEYCGKLESELKSRDPSNFIATWHHFSYVNFINVNADEAARLRCLKLAMRLIRDRSNNRPFPSNVSAIPKDPFTGKPLIYRRTSQGFMLYSLGTNLKDDQLKSSPGKPRDIGVRYPASSSDIAR
ncbi:MAG: hypothetical protein SFX74_03670, partial [Fimbriimonadaceae bacterium]|nr:hypothetical protein [Fimbriimonadaceae bacterium]